MEKPAGSIAFRAEKKKPGLRRAFSCHFGITGNGTSVLPPTAYMLPLLGCCTLNSTRRLR
jgi:hypothetical protein